MSELTITDLRKDKDGFWQAVVHAGEVSVPVHCRFGSWIAVIPAPGEGQPQMRDLKPAVAAMLHKETLRAQKEQSSEGDGALPRPPARKPG